MAGERISGAQQENLLTILAHDDKNGRIVARLVNPDLFEGEYRDFATRFVAYWKKHDSAPKKHAADLFADILDDKGNRRRKTYERILRNIDQLIEGLNTEYVMATLKSFSRGQTMKDAILKAAETLNSAEENSIQQVEEMLGELLRARDFEFNPGITLNDVGPIVDFLETHYTEFRLGIGPLDKGNIVPMRGGVFLLLAPPGAGKTWGLVTTGKAALQQRKKVLHISLEMSAEETAQRYYQALFSISKRDDPVSIARFRFDRDHADPFRLDAIGKRIEVRPDYTFEDEDIRGVLRRKMKPFTKRIPNLIIKRFPPRQLSIEGLRAFLDNLEATQGFIPDMVILDYIGIMETDAKNHRISLGRVMEDFRAVMVERNCAGVTASQVGKAGAEASLVKLTHVAEDWSLIATADVAVTYSQTAAEKRLGLARLFVGKARSEADHYAVVVTQAYAIGQFAIQAARLNKEYTEYVKEETTDEDKGMDERAGDEDQG